MPNSPVKADYAIQQGSINSVSADLLEDIFVLVLEDDLTEGCYTQVTAPINISRVCRYWRIIVLDRHRLWTTLIATPGQSHVISRLLRHFSHFLGRSGATVPITLTINANVKDKGHGSRDKQRREEWSVATFDKCLDSALLVSERWENVKILFPNSWGLIKRPRGSCPLFWHRGISELRSLKRLDFASPVLAGLDYVEIDLSDSQAAESVNISGTVHVHLGEHVELPRLTRLLLDISGGHEEHRRSGWIYRIMERMPNLDSLTITVYTHSSLGLIMVPITLPIVKRLTVICRGLENHGSIPLFLSSIRCPALEELVVDSTMIGSAILPAFAEALWSSGEVLEVYTFGLVSFIVGSGCQLTSLMFKCDFIPPRELEQILYVVPKLRRLLVHGIGSPNTQKRLLATIIMNQFHWLDIKEKKIVAMINERVQIGEVEEDRFGWRGCPSLESIVYRDWEFHSDLSACVSAISGAWRKKSSCLRSFEVVGCFEEKFEEHPEIKQIRSSERYVI